MIAKKIITAGLIAGAVSLAAANAAKAEEGSDKEKCFGVVKAGMNDCGSADKAHSCMGHATADGNGNEWIALPKGVCEKLVGGSLTAGAGGGEGKASCDGKASCQGKGH